MLRILTAEKRASRELSRKEAARVVPSLVLDCANAMCPHRTLQYCIPEDLQKIFIVELDLIYSFRDALLKLPAFVEETQAKHVVISPPIILFNYHDERENVGLYKQCLLLIQRHSITYDITLILHPGTLMYELTQWDTRTQARGISRTRYSRSSKTTREVSGRKSAQSLLTSFATP